MPKKEKTSENNFKMPITVFGWLWSVGALAFMALFLSEEIFAENTLYRAVLVVVVFVLYVIASFFIVRRDFIKPLKKIYKASSEIGGGNFGYRMKLKTNTKVDDIADAINDMAERLNKIHKREENIANMKTEFLTIAAHQMRTPLSGIRWIFNALTDSSGAGAGLNDTQKKLMKRGSNLTEDTIGMVNDLLNAALIEQGEFGYSFKVGSIMDAVQKVVDKENNVSQEKGIDIFFKKPTEEVPNIKFDPEKIEVALRALVDNAIKYSDKGSKIYVTLENKENEVWISVQDEGIGIPEDEVKKLFTKFFRAKNALELDTTGNGLGLYIVKNITDHHNGKVWVQSKEGQGTKFTIAIPKNLDKKIEKTEEGEIQSFLEDL